MRGWLPRWGQSAAVPDGEGPRVPGSAAAGGEAAQQALDGVALRVGVAHLEQLRDLRLDGLLHLAAQREAGLAVRVASGVAPGVDGLAEEEVLALQARQRGGTPAAGDGREDLAVPEPRLLGDAQRPQQVADRRA